MSSKKKSTKTAKKPKKKEVGENQVENVEKLQKSVVELSAMKDYLAERHFLLMKSIEDGEECHKQLNILKDDLDLQKVDYKSIRADMKRQYKTMESEMSIKIHLLETKLASYKQKLSETEAELLRSQDDTKICLQQKQEEIELLQQKKNLIQSSYEKILHEAFDNLVLKVNASKDELEGHGIMIQAKNKKILLEFGLNPLDL